MSNSKPSCLLQFTDSKCYLVCPWKAFVLGKPLNIGYACVSILFWLYLLIVFVLNALLIIQFFLVYYYQLG